MTFRILGSGTSQGVPVVACRCQVCVSADPCDQRLRASLHVQRGALSLVIDSGPDFRQQMLRHGITHVDAILYTHQHKDHTAGLDDIRGFNYSQNCAMPLYGRPSVLKQLQQEFSYIFEPKPSHPGLPRVTLHPIDGSAISLGNLNIQPIEVTHGRLKIYGYRIGDFSYLTDVSSISAEAFEQLKNTKVLVLGTLRKEPHPTHFHLAQAIDVATRIGAKQTYFTHISHLMGCHASVNAELPKGMALAYDGLSIHT